MVCYAESQITGSPPLLQITGSPPLLSDLDILCEMEHEGPLLHVRVREKGKSDK